MSWRDNLLPASLNGVPFLVKSVGNTLGRRTEVHEFPGRDDPFSEDLGRMAQKYQVSAFLIGENYASDRENLIAVLESNPGPTGLTFIHPYRGAFTVKVLGEARIKESDDQGRFAQIDFTLVESGLAFPQVPIDTPAKIAFIAADLRDKLGGTRFNLLAAIGAVLKSVANGLNAAGAAIRKINGKIAGALNLVDNISAAIDAFVDAIDTLLSTPDLIMGELTQLLNSVMGLVDTFVDLIPTFEVDVAEPDFVSITLDAIEDAFSFVTEADAIPTPTPQSEQEIEAHAVITKVFKAASLASGTEQLAKLELDSADQANSIVSNLAEKFDEVLEEPFETDIQESMVALKAAMVEHFTTAAQDLPALTTTKINYSEPALVLAYRLYAQSTLDEDIIKRNKIRHPTFVPAGVDLEVLSSG